MCWAHVNFNCDKKVKAVDNANYRKLLMQDICNIQLAENYEMFMKSFDLFKRGGLVFNKVHCAKGSLICKYS